MALYKPHNFVEDITNMLQIENFSSEQLKDRILYIKIEKGMSWISFNEKLKSILEDFMKEINPNFVLPDINSGYKNINVPDIEQAV